MKKLKNINLIIFNKNLLYTIPKYFFYSCGLEHIRQKLNLKIDKKKERNII